MGVVRFVLFAAMLLCAPRAAASDPLGEEACIDSICAGAGTCVPDTACVPRDCEPVIDCRGELGPSAIDCATNVSIDGRTCQIFVGLSFFENNVIALPFYGDATGTGVAMDAQVTNGSVNALNLVNTWVSPGAEANARAGGIDLGTFYVGLYRSDILTEGPRGGPYGTLAPSENHTWTQVGVVAGHDGGPEGSEDATFAVELLDLLPDGCFLRSYGTDVPSVDCPRLHELYP